MLDRRRRLDPRGVGGLRRVALGLAAIARSKTEGDRRNADRAGKELVAIAPAVHGRGSAGPGRAGRCAREQSGLFASPRSWHDGGGASASNLMLHAAIDLWELDP